MQEEEKMLAWHETLELHELIAFQSNVLFKLKQTYQKIAAPEIKALYRKSIDTIEENLQELLPFFANVPAARDEQEREETFTGFYAGDLLGAAKAAVRNYAAAITETATPELRAVLTRHILGTVRWHEEIYNFMHKRGYYPAYNLNQMLANDVKNAQTVLKIKY
ncbi:MAG: spore coat protein [Ectobacillus sp.]